MHDVIQSMEQDEDGIWVHLKPGWQDGASPTCHAILVNTEEEARNILKGVIPCFCNQCNKRIKRKTEHRLFREYREFPDWAPLTRLVQAYCAHHQEIKK